ncbi:hypothetical protein [Mucilaginibacter sp. KACC 22063]|nr:hypothetical protein [Mucilaginibacter sp. KACC 22063]WDF54231.1 hypothetical protein PQ461_14890 [Mucilaginibacter sp. KACC 22063]
MEKQIYKQLKVKTRTVAVFNGQFKKRWTGISDPTATATATVSSIARN